jgi:MYXO-CTERM domain-containing protein
MARFFCAVIFVEFFLSAGRAFAGACPTGADYLSQAMDAQKAPLVTLASLGVTDCYYISAAGSDSNTGADEGHPWAHLPGMGNCTSNCAAATPGLGSGFIFRGGETWGGASIGIAWNWSGSATNPIYIGVDKAWYAGSSWARPIWTCDGSTCVGADDANFFNGSIRSYLIVDNFEVTGLFTTSANTDVHYFLTCGQHDTVENIYAHGWKTDVTGAGAGGSVFSNGCGEPNTGSVYRYNIADGIDSSQNMMTFAATNIPIAYGNYMRYLVTGIDGLGDDWHDNICEYQVQGPVTEHQDCFYHVSQSSTPHSLIYNNIARHDENPLLGGAVKLWLNGNAPCPYGGSVDSCISYAFNNLLYDNYNGNMLDTGGHWAQNYGTWYIFNNTIQCGIDTVMGDCSELADNGNGETTSSTSLAVGTGTKTLELNTTNYDLANGSPAFLWNGNELDPPNWMKGTITSYDSATQTVTMDVTSTRGSGTYASWSLGGQMTLIRSNNHYVSTGSEPPANHCTHYACSQTGDLVQSLSAANGEGYLSASPEPFEPTKATGGTVGAGMNEESLCATIASLDEAAGAACRSSTGYACTYDTSDHTVSCPAITPIARPTSARWDVGAYQCVPQGDGGCAGQSPPVREGGLADAASGDGGLPNAAIGRDGGARDGEGKAGAPGVENATASPGGCGCHTASRKDGTSRALLGFALAGLLVARRRRLVPGNVAVGV